MLTVAQKKSEYRKNIHRGITIAIVTPYAQKPKRFSINYSILKFAILMLVSVIMLAAFSPFLSSLVEQEKEKVAPEAKAWIKTVTVSEYLFHEIDENILYLKNEGENLHSQIWDNATYHYSSIQTREENLQENTKYLKSALEFIANREKVFRDLPIGFPIEGGYTTSPFGAVRRGIDQETDQKTLHYHTGYDIANIYGTPIHATAPGVVHFAGNNGSNYGNYIVISHKYGFETLFAHCLSLNARQNQKVKRGDVVAFLGSTGLSTGAHVHYEVRLKQKDSYEVVFLNPWPFINNSL